VSNRTLMMGEGKAMVFLGGFSSMYRRSRLQHVRFSCSVDAERLFSSPVKAAVQSGGLMYVLGGALIVRGAFKAWKVLPSSAGPVLKVVLSVAKIGYLDFHSPEGSRVGAEVLSKYGPSCAWWAVGTRTSASLWSVAKEPVTPFHS
jgi:hypothetical protein